MLKIVVKILNVTPLYIGAVALALIAWQLMEIRTAQNDHQAYMDEFYRLQDQMIADMEQLRIDMALDEVVEGMIKK